MEPTPDTAPDDFEPVKGSRAQRGIRTGEIWEMDQLHRDHWEVYKNKKRWEGRRQKPRCLVQRSLETAVLEESQYDS